MKDRLKKVVGYFAIRTGTINILCDGDACVIAGSHKALNKYISKLIGDNSVNYSIKKTRYDEILQGMRMGGVYTFDNKAYNKFLPLAKADGMPLGTGLRDGRACGTFLGRACGTDGLAGRSLIY